ncbi:hypothetical protein BGW42_004529 [Actinomortierella wolfii]|nr:hypothetical protein BGW42_004529 [Actinomortierella wolfii]
MRWDNARFSSTSDRWEFPRGHPMSRDYGDSGQSSPRAVFIRTTLTWAVCSPVLENIEHLYVEENDMQRYITAANRLRSIQTIVVNVQQNYDNACEKAIKLVRRIHEIHGKNRLRDCRLLPNPFSPVYRSSGDYDVTNILRLYSLLPPNAWTPMRIPRTDGGVVVLDRVFDRDIAELDQVEVIASNVLQHYYSDLTRGEILQRFRSIKKLSVGLSLSDTRVFEWAADEARYRQAHSESTQSSKWIPPAVPVEDLNLILEATATRIRFGQP